MLAINTCAAYSLLCRRTPELSKNVVWGLLTDYFFFKNLTRAQDSGEIGLLSFKHSIEYFDYKVIIKKIIFLCVYLAHACMKIKASKSCEWTIYWLHLVKVGIANDSLYFQMSVIGSFETPILVIYPVLVVMQYKKLPTHPPTPLQKKKQPPFLS